MKPSEYIAKGWCQGVAAKDDSGAMCYPEDSRAREWCLIGALIAVYPEANKTRQDVTTKLQHALGELGFAKWNDDPKRTKQEVIDLLESIGE